MTHYADHERCPGFITTHDALNGVCVCGLYWEGTMPEHWPDGGVMSEKLLGRLRRRRHQQVEAERRRGSERREAAMVRPYGRGHPRLQ